MEVEVEPVLDRGAKTSVEQFVEVGHHVGDGAEHALRSRDAFRQPGEPRAVAHALDAEQAGAPAARSGRASVSRIASKTGQEIASCGATRIEMGAQRLVPCA